MDIQRWAEANLSQLKWRHVVVGTVVALLVAYAAGARIAAVSAERDVVVDRGGNVPGVISHMYNRRDARGFIPRVPEAKQDDVFDLAIIADSSFLIINPPPEYAHKGQARFTLTKMIAAHIGKIGGKSLRIHEYYQDGTRTADIRRVVLHSLEDPNIDAVVVALNPFLYFNDFMAFAATTQRSKLLYADGLEFSDYTMLASTLRPSDLMMDALSVVFPLYERRYPMSQLNLTAVRSTFGTGLPFPLIEARKGGPAYMIFDYIKWFYPPEVEAKVRTSRSQLFYAASIQANNLGRDSVGQSTFRANLRSLEAWGKPAILYVPPVNPDYTKDPSWPMVEQIIRQFELVRGQFVAPNIKLVTDLVKKPYEPLLYHDPYHMKSGLGFVHQFADMLERELAMPIERRDVSSMFGPGS